MTNKTEIISKLRMAQVSSCACLTKTNEASYHDADCLYRVLSEAISAIAAPAADHCEDALGMAGPVVERQPVSFSSLCYGAKFKYSSEEAAIWVKIGHDLIAGWDAGKVSDTWIGQPICSFSDDGDLSALVCLVADQSTLVSVALPDAERACDLAEQYVYPAHEVDAAIVAAGGTIKVMNQRAEPTNKECAQ